MEDSALDDGGEDGVGGKDNRHLHDGDDAQELGEAEISAMRAAGASGREIVQALVANSATFSEKTAFSQAKYIKRKVAKYVVEMSARWPSARAVCDAVLGKDPHRVHGLRRDSLGILLSLANAGAHARVLVLDDASALVERLGGHGVVCAVQDGGKAAANDLVRSFNFTEEHYRTLSTVSLSDLQEAKAQTASMEVAAPPLSSTPTELGGNVENVPDTPIKHFRKPCSQHKPSAEELRNWTLHGFTSLVMGAPTVDPITAVENLMPFLASSAPFVIYSPWQGPLVECMNHLYENRQAIGLQLFEPWFRPHQVLENRTHPEMSMHGTGGYLMCGIKVTDTTEPMVKAGGKMGGGISNKRAKRCR
eukprot:CAMPEP_0114288098 /NCGR_PEP_ID=MMETSP0059-20121206/6632_1 /TAXON_ID=36894 /ORGANISM="Pyramimonas parkeae, Strain CCMP726" /LENGTH=362 /DNA_ID=CAMNT_0001409227 /DNA_START=69 /DNA_END=1158 /DNA_ORIENTATION=-